MATKKTVQGKEIKDRPVRLLRELALLHNLSPFSLAPIVKASAQQIYRWFAGDPPKPGSLALIEQAVRKIEAEFPDPGDSAEWSSAESPESADAIAAEKEVSRELGVVFGRLMTAAADSEKRIYKIAWPGFAEIAKGLRRHGIHFII